MTFKCPFTLVIAGPSSCGKSTWVKKLLLKKEKLFDKPRGKVFYFYNSYDKNLFPFLERNELVQSFTKGLPDLSWMQENATEGENPTLILDDLMLQVRPETQSLFTEGSHHCNFNVIFLVQNMFLKALRTITLNCKYALVFKNPREVSQINHWARQICGSQTKAFCKMFRDLTKEPYSYVLFDFNQSTSDDCRYITNLFGENKTPFIMTHQLTI